MIIDDLISKGWYLPAYVLARYCYRVGLPTVDDAVYDQIEEYLREHDYEKAHEWLERSYDDDPIPTKLLELTKIPVVEMKPPTELYEYLEEEKSNSIRAVRDMHDVYDFVNRNRGKQIMFSLKLDGVNSKSLWKDERYQLSLSRGRKGNSLDYTPGAKYVLPRRIEGTELLKITGEFFVNGDALPALREKYGADKYKTSKSSAISMLRVEHKADDYSDLMFLAYSVEGKVFDKVTDMYKYLESLGFETPPYLVLDQFPQDYAEFEEFINSVVLDRLAVAGKALPSDGVVMEVNDLNAVYKDEHQYSERQLAIKFGHWDFEYLVGTITDIIIEQKRVHCSVRIKIEPMHSADGCKAEYLNSFNPSILIENDLQIGKQVYFERNSGAVNIIIHGKRLQGLTGGDSNG